MNNVYYVGSGELTFSIIERIINENLKLELAPEAEQRIRKCRDYLDRKIAASTEPLYGITTGFGSLCSKNISSDELNTLQENLVKSHACSVGEELRPVIIKLMLLLKAHALSLGHDVSADDVVKNLRELGSGDIVQRSKDFAAAVNVVCTDHCTHIRHRPVGNLASVGEYGQIRFGIRIVVQFQRTGNDRHSLLP